MRGSTWPLKQIASGGLPCPTQSMWRTQATAILIDPCTGAVGAASSWIWIAAAPPGRRSYVGAHGTGGLGGSRRFGLSATLHH
jgi:hypothetical protein